MELEVINMLLINPETQSKFPILEIYGFDFKTDNVLGAPYTIQQRLHGVPAYAVFYDKQDPVTGMWMVDPKSWNNPKKIRQRKIFLNSLVQKLSLLSGIRRKKMGMLTFGEGREFVVRDYIQYPHMREHQVKRTATSSTAEFYSG